MRVRPRLVQHVVSAPDQHALSVSQHHIASPYNNVISLCQSPDVDLVSVVSPPYLHAEQMIGEHCHTIFICCTVHS